ncbi:hypothetical protein DL240_01760 [Lujinxingia litoralis]|uniref:Uncharacterized protein n=1 Tax=Lujinxingia litoralis TaxID=2211119 RepID=A0A328CCK6_9DELT|nr:hypothetical protein [Lujinxingia litoralis]RAL24961.1 hypothetical protein DL240_01760 [Lujinxingia litoralis]
MMVAQAFGWGVASLVVGGALGVFLTVNIWRERRLLNRQRLERLDAALGVRDASPAAEPRRSGEEPSASQERAEE